MSTHYMFVDKERDAQLKNMRAMLLAERNRIIAAINQFSASNKKITNDADDAIFALQQCSAFGWYQAYEEEHVIGYASASRFTWNHDNGFGCLEKVQQFLDEHSEYVIYNEYGDEISFNDFKDIINQK